MPAFPTVRLQPQAAPLNEEAQQAIVQLRENKAARDRLQARHAKAALTLREVAGSVNDRAFDARARHEQKLRKLEAAGEEESEDELNEYSQFQNQVKDITDKLDLGLRGIIDDSDWLASVPEALKALEAKSGFITEQTQRTENTIPMTTQRSRRGADDEDEDTEISGNDGRPATTQLDPSDAPTVLLQTAFETQASSWNKMSLTDRYAKSNLYKEFYRIIHDSKHRDRDEVPVPHETMWFAAEEGRQTETAMLPGAGNGTDEDDDVQVDHVVIRIKCPFTLQAFQDPVTSKKCPHSFERSAFNEVLKATDKYLPFTPEQIQELDRCRNRAERTKKEKEIGIRAVQCPECNMLLAEGDVERNPVLQRKVRRMLAEKQREREPDDDSEDDEDDLPRGTQRKPVGLGSSPPSRRTSGRVHDFKAESGRVPQSSMPPSTQTTTAGATVVDLGGEDDDEMDDE